MEGYVRCGQVCNGCLLQSECDFWQAIQAEREQKQKAINLGLIPEDYERTVILY